VLYLLRQALPGLLLVCFLGPLGAQTPEIVVTATKEPVYADTLPVEVTVLADELTRSSTVAEALSQTLAVRLDTLSPGQSVLAAPGFGENGFGRVSLLVDGFSQANTEMKASSLNLVPLFALDRIEVLSAGAPSLYGSGSVAGAVNLVTKIPDHLAAEASVTLESTLTNRETLAVSLPVGSGAVLVSVARDQNLPSRDRSDSEVKQAWVQGNWLWSTELGDQELRTWVSVSQGSQEFPGALLTAEYQADPTQSTKPDDSGDLVETKAFAAWSLARGDWSMSVPLSLVSRVGQTQYPSMVSFTKTSYLLASASPRFQSKLPDFGGLGWDLSGGLDSSWSTLTVDRYPDQAFSNRTIRAVIDRWTGAGWSRIEGNWDQRFYLSASGRLEGVRTQAESHESPAIDRHRDDLPWSGQIGLTWRPVTELKVGVEGARVYRYPFTDEMISYWGDSGWGNSDVFYTDLKPETGLSGALSADLKLAGWTLKASTTWLRMADEIVYDTATFRNQNIGETFHRVGRLQVEDQVTPWWTAGGEATYEQATFLNGAHEGDDIPLVPLYRGRTWVRFSHEAWGFADLSWALTGPFWKGGDEANTLTRVSAAQNLSFGVTAYLGSPHWRIRVSGKNLTDDRTPTSVFYSAYSGNTGWYPLEGRVFGLTFSWDL